MTDYRRLFNHIRGRTILQMSLLNLYKLQNDAAWREISETIAPTLIDLIVRGDLVVSVEI